MEELASRLFDTLVHIGYKYVVTRDGWYYAEIYAGSDDEAITKFNNREYLNR